MQLHDCWAKTDPFQSVPTHAKISGRVAQLLLTQWLSPGDRAQLSQALALGEAQLCRFAGYLVSLHDIGKLEYRFQAQDAQTAARLSSELRDPGLFQPGVRHEKTGQYALKTIWKERGEDRQASELFSKVIGAHHQGKNGNGNFQIRTEWYEMQCALERGMREAFLGSCNHALPIPEKSARGKISALMLGLLILSDWISSGPAFADAEDWIRHPGAEARIRETAEEFLSRSMLRPVRSHWGTAFCDVWKNFVPSGLRRLQRDTEALLRAPNGNPLLLLIEAPMGEGKTEAGVYAALQMARLWGKDGLYLALPTAATANQMVGRMEALLSMHEIPKEVRLLHSMAWLERDAPQQIHSPDERDEIERWLAPTRRGLLAQFSVGTVDQAMLAATIVRYGVLRLLGLSNKVLVIDEIHSYDAYMSAIIVCLLAWCRALQIPVVMLSATLPPAMKQKVLSPYTDQPLSEAYPLITMISDDGALTERVVAETSHRMAAVIRRLPILRDAEAIARAAAGEVRDGGCLCILMNTVREAQAVYSALRECFDGDLLLFHAQFPAERRSELERACIRRYGKDKTHRPKRSVLVATQVVEQSLDVDFDVMYTAVAPIDLLLQRLGRVFRHEDTPRPENRTRAEVSVLVPERDGDFGSSAYVYPECMLSSAIRCLSGVSEIRIPEDVPGLVKAGYDPQLVPEKEVRKWQENQIREQVEAGASTQFLLGPPEKAHAALNHVLDYEDGEEAYALSVQTRLGEPTVRIALLPQEALARNGVVIRETNGVRRAEAQGQTAAKWVMKHSLSVSLRRLGAKESNFSYIIGDKLLSGVRIYPSENGSCTLENGKILRIDPELGFLIEDGEV